MKKYVAPSLQLIELRAEESLADLQNCNGACTEDVVYNGITYHALTYS